MKRFQAVKPSIGTSRCPKATSSVRGCASYPTALRVFPKNLVDIAAQGQLAWDLLRQDAFDWPDGTCRPWHCPAGGKLQTRERADAASS